MRQLNIKSLDKSYQTIDVLSKVNLSYSSGTINGVIGINGSGKSTLLNCIGGYISYGGTIERININSVGLLSANPYMFPRITGNEFVNFALSAKKQKVDVKQLNRLNSLFELPLNRFADEYSTGMLKKLHLLALLLQQNDLLLLDEPFNGLDGLSSAYLSQILLELRKQDVMIIISSHDINRIVEICDTITVVENGTAYIRPKLDNDIQKELELRARNEIERIFNN